MPTLDIKLRPPTPGDLKFIMSSWLKSYRNSDFSNFIPNKLYYEYHGALIKACLNRSLVTVACDPQDDDHVYGYTVYELLGDIFILHYVYVKNTFRNFGICKRMLQSVYPQFANVETFISHIDPTVARITTNKETNEPEIRRTSWFIKKRDEYKLTYNPYALVR